MSESHARNGAYWNLNMFYRFRILERSGIEYELRGKDIGDVLGRDPR
jgi:hypothetical protein